MAAKDVAARALTERPKIFADVFNAYGNNGEQVIDGADLYNLNTHSPTYVNGELHDQERDSYKRWAPKDETGTPVCRAHLGIENQSAADKYMALRIAGYDGADYHEQYVNHKSKRKKDENENVSEDENANDAKDPFVPVFTYVLYFGLTHWTTAISKSDAIDTSWIPKR